MLMFADVTVGLKSVMDVLIPLASLIAFILVAVGGLIAYFFKRLLSKVDNIADEIRPIRPAIIELQGLLTPAKLKRLMFPLTVAPGSPLQVTEYGDKLMKESGFYDILKSHSEMLVGAVVKKKPKTNYDIQESSIEVIKDLLGKSEPVLVQLKKYAFDNGLEVDMLIPPAGVTLRDEVMKTLKFDDEG